MTNGLRKKWDTTVFTIAANKINLVKMVLYQINQQIYCRLKFPIEIQPPTEIPTQFFTDLERSIFSFLRKYKRGC